MNLHNSAKSFHIKMKEAMCMPMLAQPSYVCTILPHVVKKWGTTAATATSTFRANFNFLLSGDS